MSKRKSRTTYNKEFQDSAVHQVLSQGKSAAEVARELDIPSWKLQGWVRKALKSEGHEKLANGKTVADELLQLKKELKNLKMENEILKKAAAYFAKTVT